MTVKLSLQTEGLILGIKHDLWAVICKEIVVTHEPRGNQNSSKHWCSHDGYKQRVLKIPNLWFQLGIQRQREEEKRCMMRDLRWKRRGWQKEGIRKHVSVHVRTLRNTLRPSTLCVCGAIVQGGGQLQPWWRQLVVTQTANKPRSTWSHVNIWLRTMASGLEVLILILAASRLAANWSSESWRSQTDEQRPDSEVTKSEPLNTLAVPKNSVRKS